MNRLFSAAQHYAETQSDAARRELIEAARDAYLATLAVTQIVSGERQLNVRGIQGESLFHAAGHALVERAECESCAQGDFDDYHGRVAIPEPCDCRGGVCCQGLLSNGLTENHRRCKALSTGD